MELAVGRRARRVVADQVIGAAVPRDLTHAGDKVVAVHDGAAVGIFGERPQRIHRRAQILRIGLKADPLIDVELEARQTARVDRINRHVVAIRRVENLSQIGLDVDVGRPRCALFGRVADTGLRIERVRIAGSRHRRVGVPHLRRHHVAVSLADDD